MKQRCTKSATTISNIHGKHTNEKRLLNFHSEALAEREGFEPPVPCGIRPLYHLSLQMIAVDSCLFASAKVRCFVGIAKSFAKKICIKRIFLHFRAFFMTNI